MNSEHSADVSQQLGSAPVGRLLLKLAAPAVAAQLVNLLYNIVDRIYIGHMPQAGTAALTGVGLCFPVIYLISAFTMLIAQGGAPRAAIAMGQGDNRRAETIMGSCFTCLVAAALALTALFWAVGEPLLWLFGCSEETILYALPYMRIYSSGSIFVMMALGMNLFITTQGFTRFSMKTVLIGAVCNIILDPIFIYGLRMGVRGAALATVIAQVCSAAWVLAFLTGRRAILRLDRGSLGLDGPILRRVCGLGLTGFTFSVTNSLVQAIGNAQLQSCGAPSGTGDLYVAAMTAITSVREIVFQPIRGLTQGAQPVLGYNYGAGRYGRVRESIRFLTVSCLAYNVVVWLLLLAFPGVFILLFNDDPALLEVGVKTMRIYYAAYVMMSFQMIGQNTFVALGRAKQAVFFSLWRKMVLVMPLMLVFPRFWGPAGVFAAEPVSDVVGGGICYLTMMATVGREMRERELAE